MKLSKKSIFRKGATLALMTAIVFGSAVPASAENTITLGITPGERNAVISDLEVAELEYAFAARPTNAGFMTLNASDGTGSQLGWNVTVSSSAFVYSATGAEAGSTGSNIAASQFSMGTPLTPAWVSGQAGLPTAVGAGGTLDSARKVITTAVNTGNGEYTQQLPVNLAIPENTSAGTYTATLTTSIYAGPDGTS